MQFIEPLIAGILIKRYKRFLADVELTDGRVVTAHTPNTGSMRGCCEPGARVWLRDSGDGRRKYPLTWELVEAVPDTLVGINTGLTNTLAREGIELGLVGELQGYSRIRQEVRYGAERSRIDLLLEDERRGKCYVEVKNVTLAEEGIALFPDAVSSRGTKHLRELTAMAQAGHRAVIFFCVQREDTGEMRPADAIDPAYGRTLRQAMLGGVEALAYSACVSTEGIMLQQALPVVCP